MQTIFRFQTHPHIRVLFTVFFCVLASSSIGHAFSDPPTVAVIAHPSGLTRGGITYIADTPVHATVTPKFDEKNLPPKALTYAVHYDGGNGATVTGTLVVPTSVQQTGVKAPAVLLLHGLWGKKEDLGLLGIALANNGYISLAIDIAGHGERPQVDGKPVGALDMAETRTVIGQTVADLHRAVDFLATRPEVDTSRIGFIGVSLGGIIGALFLGDEPRVQTASLWSAGGNWGTLMTTSSHPLAAKYHKPEITADSINQTLSDVDPLSDIGHYPHPLLFLYGDKDTVVPVPCIEALYNAAHDPKKRIIYPGGHVPDPFLMLRETIKWLDASLKKSTP